MDPKKIRKRVVYLGNIWEYPRALAQIPGVQVAAVLYEDPVDVESALQVTRQTGARGFRVATDADVRMALEVAGPVDLGVMANFGILLSELTLRQVKGVVWNFHPGLLPQQAGRMPVERLWKAGGGASGLTVHAATAQIDAGPVLFALQGRVRTELSLEENILALYRLGLPRLADTIFLQGKFPHFV